MISITQNINIAPCDGFSQITSHILNNRKKKLFECLKLHGMPEIINLLNRRKTNKYSEYNNSTK